MFDMKRVVGMTKEKGNHQRKYWVEWEEPVPGHYGDRKYSLEPAENITKKVFEDFHATYKRVEKGVSNLLCHLMLSFVTH